MTLELALDLLSSYLTLRIGKRSAQVYISWCGRVAVRRRRGESLGSMLIRLADACAYREAVPRESRDSIIAKKLGIQL